MSVTSGALEGELLASVRGGNQDAFASLIAPYRGELHAHCYRMLGSLHDAEDALQEAMLRAWRGVGRFEGRSSLRSWLYKIATNTCLDAIARRPKRVLPLDYSDAHDPRDGVGEPVVESVWIEPYPDQAPGLIDGYAAPEARYELRESVELAFVAAMQHLPPRQRAVLILREVLGYSARETADSLETSVASVNSALQRARATVEEKLPDQSQQATLRSLGDQKLQQIVERYIEAMGSGDIERVVSMLTEDAAWSMPPLASWFRGHEAIRVFLRKGPMTGEWRWRRMPTRVNGQLAIAAYTWRDDEGAFRPFAVDVLTLSGEQISDVTAFILRSSEPRTPEQFLRYPNEAIDQAKVASTFTRLGLPERLD